MRSNLQDNLAHRLTVQQLGLLSTRMEIDTDIVLPVTGRVVIYIDGGSASRNVRLAEAKKDIIFLITNTGTTNDLVIKDHNNVTLLTLTPAGGAFLFCDAEDWSVFQGSPGAEGPQGEAATIEVGTVAASVAGSDPTITNVGTDTEAVFDFVLPRGAAGPTGGAGSLVTSVAAGTVNVKNFGAVGDGVADDTIPIQDAIDYALANFITQVYVPSGTYKTTGSLYLDLPTNIRMSDPTPNVVFTVAFVGEVSGSIMPWGTIIKPADTSFDAIIVGPGRDMQIRGIQVDPTTLGGTTQAAYTGAAISLYAHGTRYLIESCVVRKYRWGIKTGTDQDGLTDSVTVFKCMFYDCLIGFQPMQVNNAINHLIDCTMDTCKYNVISWQGKAVHVDGGNYSSRLQGATYAVTSVAATFTPVSDSYFGWTIANQSFTMTVPTNDYLVNGDWDAFAVDLPGFGLVPLQRISYAAGVLTVKFLTHWIIGTYGRLADIAANQDIQAELQACTTLYACNRAIMFSGMGLSVRNVHVENDLGLTTLIDNYTGWNGSVMCSIENVSFNYNPSHIMWKGDATYGALYACQRCWPFISNLLPEFVLSIKGLNCEIQSDNLIIDSIGWNTRFEENSVNMRSFNHRVVDFTGSATSINHHSQVHGSGLWDTTPYTAAASGDTVHDARVHGMTHSPFYGNRPVPYATPRLLADELNTLLGSLSGSIGAWQPINGETLYSIGSYNEAQYYNSAMFVRFNFNGYSYGKTLNIAWSYKGQSSVVRVTGGTDSISNLFPGMTVILDNGTDGPIEYTLVRVQWEDDYFEVVRGATISFSAGMLAGTKTTTYTGSTIAQPSFYSPTFVAGRRQFTKLSNYTVTAADTGAHFDNVGAGPVNFTLPIARVGLSYGFTVLSANTLTVTAVGSSTIRVAASESAAAGTIDSATVGNSVEIYAVDVSGTVKWVARQVVGTWTVT